MEDPARVIQRGGTGEPLVLIHGFSGSHMVWQPVREQLEREHDVLAVNLAGHVGGPTLASGERVCMPAIVDAVERDMDDAGFETADVAGNSLGGWIALELAKRGRARSVVALAPAGGWEAGTRAERRLRGLFTRNHRLSKLLLPHVDGLMRRPRLRRMLLRDLIVNGDRVSPQAAAGLLRDAVACPIYFELMEAILEDGPPAAFDGVECPVLLAWGTRDRILPPATYSARLRELVPGADWLELDGLGHVPMFDDPPLIARTITEFTVRAPQPPAPQGQPA